MMPFPRYSLTCPPMCLPFPPTSGCRPVLPTRILKKTTTPPPRIVLNGKNEKIKSFGDLIEKMKSIQIPPGVFNYSNECYSVYYSLSLEDDCPNVRFSLLIKKDLTFKLTYGKYKLGIAKVYHITKNDRISFASQVPKLISYLQSNPVSNDNEIILEHLLDVFDEYCNDGAPSLHLEFIREQLFLSTKKLKNLRRYSSQLLGIASLWQTTSPSLYNDILSSNLLVLPSVKHLKRIARPFKFDANIGDSTTLNYFQKRISSLEPEKRVVSLIIDEVHSSRKIEYSNGKLYGFGDNGTPTRTLLCFLIKSLTGKYSDMVAMIPLVTLNSSKLKESFLQVLQLITQVGFTTVSVIMEDHAVNRRFLFTDLSLSEEDPSYLNPFSQEDEQITMIFDPLHVFKKIYHNFLSVRTLSFPSFQSVDGKEGMLTASLGDVESIYERELEISNDRRRATRLLREVFVPQPLRNINVSLASRLFHHSTVDALRHYSLEKSSYLETLEFLKVLGRFWTCISGESNQGESKSYQQGDEIQFLNSFYGWLSKWKGMDLSQDTLSNDTFKITMYTSKGLANLVAYLKEKRGIMDSSSLLHQINSNPLERRFGSYRQLGGKNYSLSCRQLLEREKKIRIESLLKTNILSFATLKEVFSKSTRAENVEENGKELMSMMAHLDISDLDEISGIENVIFYVSGTIAHMLLKNISEPCCKEMISSSEVDITIVTDEAEGHQVLTSFIEDLSKDGLKNPTDMLYLVTMHYYKMLNSIFQSKKIRGRLFSFDSPRQVFTSAMNNIIHQQDSLSWITTSECSNKHKFSNYLKNISFHLFNVFSKNYVSDINNQRLLASKKRKEAFSSEDSSKIMKVI